MSKPMIDLSSYRGGLVRQSPRFLCWRRCGRDWCCQGGSDNRRQAMRIAADLNCPQVLERGQHPDDIERPQFGGNLAGRDGDDVAWIA